MTCLFVGNITSTVTENQLVTAFSAIGPCKVELKGKYAFIEYENPSDSKEAMKKLNKTTLNGANGFSKLRIEFSKKKKVNDTKLRSNIWFYTVGNNMSTKDKIAFKHPAIFPEKLAEDHILSWSNEGDTVLDCFMGSNTTGKMALKNGRKYIGIEKVEDYFEIAKERIMNI